MDNELAPQQSTTPELKDADAQILSSWNEIRGGETGDDTTGDAAAGAGDDAAQAARLRDAAGKFAKAAPAADAGAAEAQPTDDAAALAAITAATDEAAGTQPVVDESPKSLRKDLADKHWSTLPPEMKAAWTERDASYQQGIERYRSGAEAGERFQQAYRPYEATLREVGATPEQAVEAFFKADHTLRYGSPAQKAAQLAQLAQNYGVALDQVQSHIQNPQAVDPVIQGLQTKVDALTAQQQQREREQAQQEVDKLTSEVVTFAKGKEHFEAVQEEIKMVLPGINQRFPELGVQEKLQRAYDIAINANPTVRAAIAAQQRATALADAQKKANDAKKAASVNVATRGVVPSAGPKRTLDESILANAQSLGLA